MTKTGTSGIKSQIDHLHRKFYTILIPEHRQTSDEKQTDIYTDWAALCIMVSVPCECPGLHYGPPHQYIATLWATKLYIMTLKNHWNSILCTAWPPSCPLKDEIPWKLAFWATWWPSYFHVCPLWCTMQLGGWQSTCSSVPLCWCTTYVSQAKIGRKTHIQQSTCIALTVGCGM